MVSKWEKNYNISTLYTVLIQVIKSNKWNWTIRQWIDMICSKEIEQKKTQEKKPLWFLLIELTRYESCLSFDFQESNVTWNKPNISRKMWTDFHEHFSISTNVCFITNANELLPTFCPKIEKIMFILAFVLSIRIDML